MAAYLLPSSLPLCECADGEAFAKYTARIPHFEVLRELGLLKSPINGQVREASQDNGHVPTGQGETPVDKSGLNMSRGMAWNYV